LTKNKTQKSQNPLNETHNTFAKVIIAKGSPRKTQYAHMEKNQDGQHKKEVLVLEKKKLNFTANTTTLQLKDLHLPKN